VCGGKYRAGIPEGVELGLVVGFSRISGPAVKSRSFPISEAIFFYFTLLFSIKML
jgi:hypothetical protein